jgi:hypothetical protein
MRSKSTLPLPPTSTTPCNHGHPNVHLTVPRGIVAHIQFAKDHRTSLPRLHLHLIFPRAPCGLGVPRRFKVESRGGISANFPNRVFLFDHLGQAEDRVPGEELGATSPRSLLGRLPGSFDIVWRLQSPGLLLIQVSKLLPVPHQCQDGCCVLLLSRVRHSPSFLILAVPTLTHNLLFSMWDRRPYVDEWLRESNQTMIFRILFEDRVSGKPWVCHFVIGPELTDSCRDCRSLPLNRHISRFVFPSFAHF